MLALKNRLSLHASTSRRNDSTWSLDNTNSTRYTHTHGSVGGGGLCVLEEEGEENDSISVHSLPAVHVGEEVSDISRGTHVYNVM